MKIESDSMQLTIDGIPFSGLKSVQWDEPTFKDVSLRPIPLDVTKGMYKAEGGLTIERKSWHRLINNQHKPVDLRKCYVSDRLLSQHGEILIYRGPSGTRDSRTLWSTRTVVTAPVLTMAL